MSIATSAVRLFAVDQMLALGDTVGEDSCLERKVRVLVVCVAARTGERTVEPLTFAQVISRFFSSASSTAP